MIHPPPVHPVPRAYTLWARLAALWSRASAPNCRDVGRDRTRWLTVEGLEDRNAPGSLLDVLLADLLSEAPAPVPAATELAEQDLLTRDSRIWRGAADDGSAITGGAGWETEGEQDAPSGNGSRSHPTSKVTDDFLKGASNDPFLGLPTGPAASSMIMTGGLGPVAGNTSSGSALASAPSDTNSPGVSFGTESTPTSDAPAPSQPASLPLSIAASGGAPVAEDDSYTVVHDRTLAVDATEGLLANDTDPEGDPLQVVLVTQPTHGTLTFQDAAPYGDGSFNYLPESGYKGTDSFTYTISDGTSESDPATVTITVTNAAPTIVGEPDFQTAAEDDPLSGSVLDNDSDADGDPIQAVLTASPTVGDLVFHDDGTFTYTPPVNFGGRASFSYAVTDGIDTSSPVTVGLQYGPQQLIDIDGQDTATQGEWMHEDDEAAYGVGVSVDSSAASALVRTGDVQLWYPGYEVVQRSIVWDSSALAVNGSTDGQMELSPTGSNEVLTITALQQGYEASSIAYHIVLEDPATEEFVDGENNLPVVEQKAVLRQLQFTSDHDVIRANTKIVTTSGDKYNAVEYVRRTGYNAPMTQTMSYTDEPSKMAVQVTVDWAGIPANTTIKLVGTSTESALQFESGLVSTAALPGTGLVPITATNDVGDEVRTINATIAWSMVVNPGAANEKTLPMGTSGAHKIYVLFGKPANQDRAPLQVTDIRLDRTVAVASQALADAWDAVFPAEPTWQRIAFQIVQLQRFNLKGKIAGPTPLNDRDFADGWKVYDTWTGQNDQGADCISGAIFSSLVVAASGMPGTRDVDCYVLKSEAEKTTAVSWVYNDPARLRNGGTEELMHLDGDDNNNRFEAALIYTPPEAGASTFYFPVGAGDARFTNKDDVLTVFASAVWINLATGKPVGKTVIDYVRAQNANID